MANEDHQASDGRAEVPAPNDDTQEAGGSPDVARPSSASSHDPGADGWQGPVASPWPGVAPEPAGERAGRSWSGRKTAAAVAVAVGLAATGGVALATSDSSLGIGNVAFTGPGYGSGYGGYGPEGQPGGGRGGGGGHGPMGGVGRALHGEFVVPDGSGGYVTRVMQAGKVTAVDSGKIAVTSDDGYAKTYTITSTTTVHGVAAVTDLKVDAVVTVIADQSGAALSIGDRSAMPERGQGGPPDRRQGGKGAPPQGTAPGEATPPSQGESSAPTEPSAPQPTT